MRGDHGPGWAEIALRITAHSRESGGAILVVQTRRLVPVLIGLRMTGTGTKLSFAEYPSGDGHLFGVRLT